MPLRHRALKHLRKILFAHEHSDRSTPPETVHPVQQTAKDSEPISGHSDTILPPTAPAQTWLDFHPHVDLIQLPLGHPGLNELPYIRDQHFTHAQLPKARRWSFPAYVHSGGAQTQLVASLHRVVDQGAEIQVLNTRVAEQNTLIDDRDDHIERLLADSEGKPSVEARYPVAKEQSTLTLLQDVYLKSEARAQRRRSHRRVEPLEEDRGSVYCELIMPDIKAVEERRVRSGLRWIRERCSLGTKSKAKRAALAEAERKLEETLEAVAMVRSVFRR